jgi:hypothetical protein
MIGDEDMDDGFSMMKKRKDKKGTHKKSKTMVAAQLPKIDLDSYKIAGEFNPKF